MSDRVLATGVERVWREPWRQLRPLRGFGKHLDRPGRRMEDAWLRLRLFLQLYMESVPSRSLGACGELQLEENVVLVRF